MQLKLSIRDVFERTLFRLVLQRIIHRITLIGLSLEYHSSLNTRLSPHISAETTKARELNTLHGVYACMHAHTHLRHRSHPCPHIPRIHEMGLATSARTANVVDRAGGKRIRGRAGRGRGQRWQDEGEERRGQKTGVEEEEKREREREVCRNGGEGRVAILATTKQ